MTGNRNIVGNYFNLQEQLSVKVFPGDEDKISEVEEELTGRQEKESVYECVICNISSCDMKWFSLFFKCSERKAFVMWSRCCDVSGEM